jgi:hypothetical protein
MEALGAGYGNVLRKHYFSGAYDGAAHSIRRRWHIRDAAMKLRTRDNYCEIRRLKTRRIGFVHFTGSLVNE